MILADSDEPKLLLQEYDAPPVAVKLIAVLVHVNTVDPLLLIILALGANLSDVMVIDSSAVHPFAAVTRTA